MRHYLPTANSEHHVVVAGRFSEIFLCEHELNLPFASWERRKVSYPLYLNSATVLLQLAFAAPEPDWGASTMRIARCCCPAQINKNPPTGRLPLGEADVNAPDQTLPEGALAAAAAAAIIAQKKPRSAAQLPPASRSAAPPPVPPPMPARGSLFAGKPHCHACALTSFP